MAIHEPLREIRGPGEFDVEYIDGTRERPLRGDGVLIVPPADDPKGCGGPSARLPSVETPPQLGGFRLWAIRSGAPAT
ncbi:hypothetical protein OJF2_76170 [Aquisphaera giovannonii]|uniref:Uncharacterized protein n=1 Tax=Aquisphaera giovannonii TaxID=406548 RepID=A0A5B9WG62_9BACT|nr:hypothetical protein OJF2_76170 [Aquisphaera giovannonii]